MPLRTHCCHDNARETQREARWEAQKTPAFSVQPFSREGKSSEESFPSKCEINPRRDPRLCPSTLLRGLHQRRRDSLKRGLVIGVLCL